jgi:hypothetical protein
MKFYGAFLAIVVSVASAQAQRQACDAEALATAERLRAFEACQLDEDPFACTPLFSDVASSTVIGNLTAVVGARAVAELAIPRVPQIFRERLHRQTLAALGHISTTLRNEIIRSGSMTAEEALRLQVTLRGQVPGWLNLRTGQITSGPGATARVLAQLPSGVVTQLRREAADTIVGRVFREDMPAVRASGALYNTTSIRVANPRMVYASSVNGLAGTVGSMSLELDRQAIVHLTRDMTRRHFVRSLPFGLRHTLLRSLNFRSLFSPRAIVASLPVTALAVTAGLLGTGYRVTCTADEALDKLAGYPGNRDIDMDDFRSAFQVGGCQTIMSSWESLTNVVATNISCRQGAASFELLHYPDNQNYCGGSHDERGERLRTPVQVLFNSQGVPTSVSHIADDLGTRATNWGNARWRDVGRDSHHRLRGKLSGVMPYVMQECRQRSQSGYAPLASLTFGTPVRSGGPAPRAREDGAVSQ